MVRTAFPFAQRRIVPQSAPWPGLWTLKGHCIHRQSCQLSPFPFSRVPSSRIHSILRNKQRHSNASLPPPLFLSFLVSLLAIDRTVLYCIIGMISSSPPGPLSGNCDRGFPIATTRSQISSTLESGTDFFSFSSFSRTLITFFPRRILRRPYTADGAPHNQQPCCPMRPSRHGIRPLGRTRPRTSLGAHHKPSLRGQRLLSMLTTSTTTTK